PRRGPLLRHPISSPPDATSSRSLTPPFCRQQTCASLTFLGEEGVRRYMLLSRRFLSVILGFASGTALSCGPVPSGPAVGSRREPIYYGTIDSIHPSTVMLIRYDIGALCSGSVIAPRTVVTARH